MAETDLDGILEELGQFGRFQIVSYILISVPMIFVVVSSTSFVFTSGDLDYRCRVPECDDNGTVFRPEWLERAVPMEQRSGGLFPQRCHRYEAANLTLDTCPAQRFLNTTVRCHDWVFLGEESTIVREWNLTCEENKWKLTVAGTLIYTGALLSKPFAGFVSDRFGRKVLLLGGLGLAATTGAIRGMSNSLLMFHVCNLLEGIFGGGIYSAAFVMGLEMLGPSKRVLGGTIMSTYNAVGEILMGAIAWGLQSWRMIHVLLYAPSVLFVSYIWLLPESIRWLLAKGREEEAKVIIYRAARTNRVVLSESYFKSLTSLHTHTEAEPGVAGNRRGALGQAVRSRVLMLRLLMCSFCWACIGFTFSGLTFNATSLGGNKYVNFMLAGLIELPGHMLTYFGMDRLGRKATLCGSLAASGVCCLLYIAVPADMRWLAVGLYLLGKFSITTSYDVLYMYAAELFPTSLRHSMMSACSMLGGIGTIAAPQTPLLASYYEPLPLIIFSAATLVSAALTLLLPETRGARLPDTIEEAEDLGKRTVQTAAVDAEDGIQ